MTKHVHKNISIGNFRDYETDIFQSAYDEICIYLKNIRYINSYGVQFIIPVRKKDGYRIKINKSSVSNDTGKAADLIEYLSTPLGSNFISGMVQKLIFENEKKRATPGL